ncbi:MAG: 2-dehydropantoate 2-reductase [bacterium]|nr:2-dehydropantoate 2-reductase [bacterium]
MAGTERPSPVLVAGAGALGSVLGGLLAARGWPVTLLGRREHLDAVRRHGLAIDGLYGTHHVGDLECVTEASALRGPFPTIFLTVKSWDTEATVAAVAPLLAPIGMLVVLQNGLGNLERASARVGASRVIGGRVIFGAEVTAPGHVRVTVHAAPTLLGSPESGDGTCQAAARRWAAILDAAGVPAAATDAIATELWAKVLYNAALNPLGALLGVPYGHLARDPDARAIMDAVIAETFAVAQAEGVALPWPDAAGYRELFYAKLVPSTAAHRSSMLQDLERGRPTEIDAINGHVTTRGAAHGIPTPVNATLAGTIRARVRRGREGDAAWSR